MLFGRPARRYACVCVFVLVSSAVSAGQQAAQQQQQGRAGQAANEENKRKFVTFDHLNDTQDRAYQEALGDGEIFEIRIANTCPDVFAYDVRGIYRSEQPEPQGAGTRAATKALETKVLEVAHDDQFGGYIVSITRTQNTNPCVGAEKLVNRTLVVSTPLMTWDLAFAGGFTFTNLSNPVYFLRDHPTETGKKQVQEDPDKRDDASLGIATYVHLYHHRRPWLALTFGLGIREANKTEYMVGGGYRFSDKAALVGGLTFGPVSRLPAGVNTTAGVSDTNVLNDLPTRVQRGVFVGLSYSFVNVRDRLQQPFAGTTSGAAGSTPAAQPPAQGDVCAVTVKPDTVAFPAGGGSQSVAVTTTPADCKWTLSARPAWAPTDEIAGGTIGNKTVTFKAEANGTGAAREATVTIGNGAVKLTQPAQPTK